MPQAQRDLAIRSIQLCRQILDITVNSPAYREGMKYGTLANRRACFLSSRLCKLFTIHMPLQLSRRRSYFVCLVSCKSFNPHLSQLRGLNFRFSPDQCDVQDIRTLVERLANLLAEGMPNNSLASKLLSRDHSAWQTIRINLATHVEAVQEAQGRVCLSISKGCTRAPPSTSRVSYRCSGRESPASAPTSANISYIRYPLSLASS